MTLLTLRDAALWYRVNSETLRDAIRDGRLQAGKHRWRKGWRYLLHPDDVQAYLERAAVRLSTGVSSNPATPESLARLDAVLADWIASGCPVRGAPHSEGLDVLLRRAYRRLCGPEKAPPLWRNRQKGSMTQIGVMSVW